MYYFFADRPTHHKSSTRPLNSKSTWSRLIVKKNEKKNEKNYFFEKKIEKKIAKIWNYKIIKL